MFARPTTDICISWGLLYELRQDKHLPWLPRKNLQKFLDRTKLDATMNRRI